MIDHLSPLEETGCRPLQLSRKTRCTILMYLGQEDCSPSIFGHFANGDKNRNKTFSTLGVSGLIKDLSTIIIYKFWGRTQYNQNIS